MSKSLTQGIELIVEETWFIDRTESLPGGRDTGGTTGVDLMGKLREETGEYLMFHCICELLYLV